MASSSQRPIIALLTDFGTRDSYVGSVKGAIFEIAREAVVIDICHDIFPQNILQAAFVLQAVYRDYPKGTIFVCVVDPGVGTKRLPILIEAGDYWFIGPDNGIFSYILQNEPPKQVRVLNKDKYFRHPVSATFHGRDIFGPCAAWLSGDIKAEALGDPLRPKPMTLNLPTPQISEDDCLEGQIMHIDNFGNLITNVHRSDFDKAMQDFPNAQVEIELTDWLIPFADNYAGGEKDAPIGVWGSSGYLEIAAPGGSACDILDAEPNESLRILFSLDAA